MIKIYIVIRLYLSMLINLLNTYILNYACKHVWKQLNYIISILANLMNTYIRL